MNKQYNLWQILPYAVLILIAAYFITTEINSCNKPQIIYNVRDSVSQMKIDSLNIVIQRINFNIRGIQDALLVNETGTESNRIVYIERKKQIENQTSNEDYEQIKRKLKK